MRKSTIAVSVVALVLAAGSVMAQQGEGLSGSQGASGDDLSVKGAAPAASGDVKFEPSGDKNYDVAPQWIRQPAGRFVGSVFPVQALRDGKSGSAVTTCTLTVDGALSRCAVTREEPAGLGFGAAALALAPSLNIQPASKSGRPVATQITLTTNLVAPTQRTGTYSNKQDTSGLQKVLTNPIWEQAPSYADVVAAYPAKARTENKSGRVSLSCTLASDGHFDGCTPVNEEPKGYGFGEAAMELSHTFKTADALPNGAKVTGLAYILPFTFSTRMLQQGATATGAPDLIAIPSNADLGAAFPVEARRAGVGRSHVSMACTVAAGGGLNNCGVVSESPSGYGFAAGALRLATKFKVSQWSADGLPTVGGRIQIPVDYNLTVR